MANIADCAVAIAIEDLPKLNGAIKKVDVPQSKWEKYQTVVRSYYEDSKTGRKCVLFCKNGYDETIYRLRENGKVIAETTDGNYTPIKDKLEELGMAKNWSKEKILEDKFISNGYEVDWLKLDSYSYDMTPWVMEHGDHITLYFGGRWNFPEKLENKLNEYGVRWQGAACDGSMDWEVDDLGNSDFGLRVAKDNVSGDDGESYCDYYVEDTSK